MGQNLSRQQEEKRNPKRVARGRLGDQKGQQQSALKPRNPRSLKRDDVKAAMAKLEKHLNALGEEPDFFQRMDEAAAVPDDMEVSVVGETARA